MQQTIAQFIEGPEEVQYYSHHACELKHSQQHKIDKFLEHGCIEYAGEGAFLCKPIQGYNKTTYRMVKNSLGEFECNCQYYQLKAKRGELPAYCSHIGELYEYFSRRKK